MPLIPDVPTRRADAIQVAHLRQILLWPLRLMRGGSASASVGRRPWQALRDDPARRWTEVVDEFDSTGGGRFRERHYSEFVAFLPHVQRFLYGEGRVRRGDDEAGGAPMRVFRRTDITGLRVVPSPGAAPRVLSVAHADLYFFFDVDVVLLNVELATDDLTLAEAQTLMYRVGRAYPPGWDAEGKPLNSATELTWLGADGQALSPPDESSREEHLAHVSAHRAPRIGLAWRWLLEPLMAHPEGQGDQLSYRQVQYHRMPLMAYLSVDDPRAICADDWLRLGQVMEPAPTHKSVNAPPARVLREFKARHVDDRFWNADGSAPFTRYLLGGVSLVVVGDARAHTFCCGERGVLAQFRHQHFLAFLIAHFQKAALLAYADKLVSTLELLDVADAERVREFKRSIRAAFEAFLRFTHRYWFHDVAEQAHLRSLFRRTAALLNLEELYDEVKSRIEDMENYLESDSVRRQSSTVVRLTVVTILGLVGSITTGALGMNLLAEADSPIWWRLFLFALTLVVVGTITVTTIVRSKQLADAIDTLANQRMSWPEKRRALGRVFRDPS